MKKAFLIFVFSAVAAAQVGVSPFKSPRATFADPTSGLPLPGGCVFTYAGGTSTPQATYTDYTGGTMNPNPITLDSSGSYVIWLGPYTYKYAVYAASPTGNCALNPGAFEWSVDQVPGNLYLNATLSGAILTNPAITGGTIDGATIGGATPAPVNASYFNGPIGTGGGAPAAGNFTSLASALDAMTFSSTPVFPAGSYGFFTLTLTNNVTSSTITGGLNGQIITLDICQNSTGGYSLAWPANLSGAPAINQNANGCTIVQAIYNSGYWTTLYSTSAVLQGVYNTVAFSATPVFSAGTYSYFTLTLTGNVTSSTISGGVNGQIATFNICQNATGGYTFAWPANVTNAPAVGPAASTCTAVPMVYNGTNWVAGFGAPTQAHPMVFADLSNAVYGASAVVNLLNVPVAGTIPAGGTGIYNGVTATSKCTLMTAATASTTFSLKDGSSTFGTAVFAASGVTATLTISSAFPVAAGDQITIVAPSTADTTAAGLNCSIVFAY